MITNTTGARDVVHIPSLGTLSVSAHDGHTLLFQTAERNHNTWSEGNVDKTVALNRVAYEIEITAHSATWFAEREGSNGGTSDLDVFWTTNLAWGLRTHDIVGKRRDVHRAGVPLTPAARTQALQHALRALNTYIYTDEFEALNTAAEHIARSSAIEQTKKSVARYRDLLADEEKRLAGLLGYHVDDLIDLSRALKNGVNLEEVT